MNVGDGGGGQVEGRGMFCEGRREQDCFSRIWRIFIMTAKFTTLRYRAWSNKALILHLCFFYRSAMFRSCQMCLRKMKPSSVGGDLPHLPSPPSAATVDNMPKILTSVG